MSDIIKIGITEAGDASLDYTWVDKINKIDGAILITKNITDKFIDTVLKFKNKLIIHATCTGMGGSKIEPNVPDYKTQLSQVQKLINSGFPAEKIIIRIDPIIPTEMGLQIAQDVINASPIKHFRFSVMDTYPHVRERFKKAGIIPPYGENNFNAPTKLFENMKSWLKNQPSNYIFECCAETQFSNLAANIIPIGCVSENDFKLLNLPTDNLNITNAQRKTCLCVTGKTELLSNRKRCPHNCLYCYWKD